MHVRLLKGLSIGYLLLPNLLFYYYWTRPVIAVIGICLLFYVATIAIQQGLPSEKNLGRRDLGSIGIVALLLTLMSGTAGICWQTFDHWGHNTKFNDLFLHEWPLQSPDKGSVISYYYGYSLIPALVSKWLG